MTDEEEWYVILNLQPDATTQEVKIAYRQLAVKLHPDKNLGDPEAPARFNRIKMAYELLKDDDARAAYDSRLQAKLAKKKRISATSDQRKADINKLEERERFASEAYKRQRDQAAADAAAKVKTASEIAALRKQFKPKGSQSYNPYADPNRPATPPLSTCEDTSAAVDPTTTTDASITDDLRRTLRVKWSKTNTPSEEELRRTFEACGAIDSIVLRERRAAIVFRDPDAMVRFSLTPACHLVFGHLSNKGCCCCIAFQDNAFEFLDMFAGFGYDISRMASPAPIPAPARPPVVASFSTSSSASIFPSTATTPLTELPATAMAQQPVLLLDKEAMMKEKMRAAAEKQRLAKLQASQAPP
jgi:curved DNA-binding protein CbpA